MATRRKFGNVKVAGFDSKREYRRAQDLQLMERAGLIQNLRLQVKFLIIPKCGKEQAASYIADFVYIENGLTVVEDSKGAKTAVYILKRKLMLHVHGITIKET